MKTTVPLISEVGFQFKYIFVDTIKSIWKRARAHKIYRIRYTDGDEEDSTRQVLDALVG